jgi:hypothetical protein
VSFRNKMHSKVFEVSFLSTGTIAKLCSDGSKIWSNTSLDLNTIQNELVSRLSFHKSNH